MQYLIIFPPYYIVYLGIMALTVLIGGAAFDKLTAPFKLIVTLVIVTGISEYYSRLIGSAYETTMPVYHVYAPVQYAFFALIYHQFLIRKTVKNLVLISAVLIIAGSVINTRVFSHLGIFPSTIMLIIDVFVVSLSLLLFLQMLRHLSSEKIYLQGVFWFNVGTLLYCCGNFLFLSTYSALEKENLLSELLHQLNLILNYVLYGCYLIAIVAEASKNNSIVGKDSYTGKSDG